MELNYFKDILLDLINESVILPIRAIETRDREDLFRITMADGSIFALQCTEEP